MTQFGPVTAVHEVAAMNLMFHTLPLAPAVQAQPVNIPNVDINGWHQPGGRVLGVLGLSFGIEPCLCTVLDPM